MIEPIEVIELDLGTAHTILTQLIPQQRNNCSGEILEMIPPFAPTTVITCECANYLKNRELVEILDEEYVYQKVGINSQKEWKQLHAEYNQLVDKRGRLIRLINLKERAFVRLPLIRILFSKRRIIELESELQTLNSDLDESEIRVSEILQRIRTFNMHSRLPSNSFITLTHKGESLLRAINAIYNINNSIAWQSLLDDVLPLLESSTNDRPWPTINRDIDLLNDVAKESQCLLTRALITTHTVLKERILREIQELTWADRWCTYYQEPSGELRKGWLGALTEAHNKIIKNGQFHAEFSICDVSIENTAGFVVAFGEKKVGERPPTEEEVEFDRWMHASYEHNAYSNLGSIPVIERKSLLLCIQ